MEIPPAFQFLKKQTSCRQERHLLVALLATLSITGCAGGNIESGAGEAPKKAPMPGKKTGKTSDGESVLSIIDEFKGREEKGAIERPDSFEKCLRRARRALRADSYKAAIQYATYAIEMQPERAEGYYWRGKARYKSLGDDTDLAIEDLEKAGSIDSKHPETFQLLAQLYNLKERRKEALEAVSRAIELDPKDRQLYEFRASLLSSLDKKELALKDLGACIALRPGEIGTYLARGKLLEAYGRDNEALDDYSKACQLTSGNFKMASGEVFKIRAGLLLKLGRHEESIKDLSLVIEKMPEDDDALRLRGDTLVSLGRYEDAISDYTRAIDISPDYARAAYEARAIAYRKIGDSQRAESDLKKARTLEGKPAEKPVFDLRKSNPED